MQRDKQTVILDAIIAVIGGFFLLMALLEAGRDEFGFRLGLVVGLCLAALLVWRKIREKRGKSVRTGGINMLLFALAVFFLTMGVTDVGRDSFGAKLGFGLGVPLALYYLWRKRRDAKKADAQELAERQTPQSESSGAVSRSGAQAEEIPLTICPHCGAPGKGEVCQYCGMSKKE